jgi:hypothetical protein
VATADTVPSGAAVVIQRDDDFTNVLVYRNDLDADRARERQTCLDDADTDIEASHCFEESGAEPLHDLDPFVAARVIDDLFETWSMVPLIAVGLLAASFLGADRSSRSLGTILTWEPRRTRVILTKLGVAAGGAAAIVAIVAVYTSALVLAGAAVKRGLDGIDASWWGDIGTDFYRTLILAALIGTVAATMAVLLRSTGAAIGALVAIGVIELVLHSAFDLSIAQFLPGTSAIAVFADGLTFSSGSDCYYYDEMTCGPDRILGAQAALVAASVWTALFVTIATVTFRNQEIR